MGSVALDYPPVSDDFPAAPPRGSGPAGRGSGAARRAAPRAITTGGDDAAAGSDDITDGTRIMTRTAAYVRCVYATAAPTEATARVTAGGMFMLAEAARADINIARALANCDGPQPSVAKALMKLREKALNPKP